MDRQFLEFWGNFLLNAARGQKQLEDIAKWMGSGFSGFEECTSLFRKIYGLDEIKKESPDYLKAWMAAQEDFNKSFSDFLSLFGVAPRQEHLALVKKYEQLKEKCESLEETVRHLRMLLSQAKMEGYQDVAGQFQELVKQQGDQFQKLMESFAQASKKETSSQES